MRVASAFMQNISNGESEPCWVPLGNGDAELAVVTISSRKDDMMFEGGAADAVAHRTFQPKSGTITTMPEGQTGGLTPRCSKTALMKHHILKNIRR